MDPRLAIVAAGIAAVAWLQGAVGEGNSIRRRADFRYTPDPRVIRVAAGAHRSTTADLIWLRTLPDLSREFSDTKLKARWIDHSLDAITDLEPEFRRPYYFGADYLTVLARSTPGAVDRAIRLLEKGIRLNPETCGDLHAQLAMVHYMDRKDHDKALEHLRAGSTLPGFDSLSAAMLASMLAKRNQDVVAIGYWSDLIATGSAELRQIAELNLWYTKEQIVKRATIAFRNEHGRPPRRPEELGDPKLVEAPVIPTILDGLALDAEGNLVLDARGLPSYPRVLELELAREIRMAEQRCREIRDETGRWPTAESLEAAGFRLKRPPAGKRWRVESGKVALVDAE
jgi:tetratricopeptide (TPR) repeat protein